ncbi:MAG: hypothetical protein ACXV4B_05390 [Halobacteriota archaeon]
MAIKFNPGEGMETVTTENGFTFDFYFSVVTEDAFDAYSRFIYLVVKRIDDPQSVLIRRKAYLVPFTLLDEFLTTVNLPGEKIVHIEPLTMEMVSFTREELRKDHVSKQD